MSGFDTVLAATAVCGVVVGVPGAVTTVYMARRTKRVDDAAKAAKLAAEAQATAAVDAAKRAGEIKEIVQDVLKYTTENNEQLRPSNGRLRTGPTTAQLVEQIGAELPLLRRDVSDLAVALGLHLKEAAEARRVLNLPPETGWPLPTTKEQ